jgi:aspartyl/glutamyl-tRNA(Asn/Gln) amidotransferase C subunit
MSKDSKEKRERTEPMAEIGEVSDAVLAEVIDLARLDPLTPGISVQKDHLRKILQYFKVLNQVHIEGIDPIIQVNPAPIPLRPDIVHPSLDAGIAMSNAHVKSGEYFVAPQIMAAERSEEN